MFVALFFAIFLTIVVGYFAVRALAGDRALASRIARAQMKSGRKSLDANAAQAMQLRRSGPVSKAPILEALVKRLPNIATLGARLERAGLSMGIGNYALLNIGIFIVVSGVMVAFTNVPPPAAVLMGVTLGLGLPHYITGFLIKRRVKLFLILFPDALELIVRGLRSGLPVAESITVVGSEIGEPVGGMFRDIANATKIGVPLEKALADIAEKAKITEFNFFVTSITLQRETGGNLAEILSNLAETLRNRLMMRMKIKAYASQAKASATIVGAMPVLIVLALLNFSPGYLDAFVADLKGNIAAFAGFASFGMGVFVMAKMVNFEI